ncbi:Bromodomain-containing protein [Xylariomycetidae sp. FL2044]|nr:Bromodomain-containing protein [Xylariomycetidae sp. FL2044]
MATEQPQSLPVDQKRSSPARADAMAIDEPAPKAVNGHSKPEEVAPKPEDTPTINGKAEAAVLTEATGGGKNRDAFEANNSIPQPKPSEPSTEPPHAHDTEMTDANDASTKDVPIATKATEKTDSPGATPSKDTSEKDAKAESVGDSMDLDASMERPDIMSSAEQADSTQNTSAMSDAPVVSATEDSIQLPSDKAANSVSDVKEDAPSSQIDVIMNDTPASPMKISRGREDDGGDEERVAKRAKTDEPSEPVADSLVVASGVPPAPQSTAASMDPDPCDEKSITPFQNRNLRAALSSVKKTKNGGNFKASVEKLWPAVWNDYIAKVPNPVDISLFEAKLREDKYPNFAAFKADVHQLYQNAVAFNGPEHLITLAAGSVRDNILTRSREISRSDEPAKPEKSKAHPTRHSEPRAATQQPRRPSQSKPKAPPASPKPKAPPSAQTATATPNSSTGQAFALPPGGIPQIRRDSTRDDNDRPKRPIHPPKNRDLDYVSKPSRKKKLEPEQRFFEKVLNEVKNSKHSAINAWFLEPVDPVALQIPNYFSLVKKPMDLGTMTQKNYDGEYKSVKDIEKDMKQIVHNAALFNGQEHDVTRLAKQLEVMFKEEVGKKNDWMKRNYPPEVPSASAPSPERNARDESDEESDGDEGAEDSTEALRGLQARLNEEQDKLNTLLGSKKPDLTMIEVQQAMVSMLQRKVVEERTKVASEEKKSKSKKKSSKSKPKPSGGAASGASKKTGNASSTKKIPPSSKKSAPKKRTIGAIEKAVIANGIIELDGTTLAKAVEIIKRDTGQNENDDGEMELDIEALSIEALGRLYDLIHKAHPEIRAKLAEEPQYQTVTPAEVESKPKSTAPSKAKKNKPMNKHEQERKIEQLRELKAQLQRHGSGSQEPIPAENEEPRPAETSEEESDSEEE